MKRTSKTPTKSFDEALWKMWKTAGKARKHKIETQLLADNMPLIRQLVLKTAKRMRLTFDLDDLMQTGAMAFLHALSKYDPDKGKFSTILGWWVLQYLQHAFRAETYLPRSRDYTMPIPIREIWDDIEQREGREATPEELSKNAKGVKVTAKDIARWKEPAPYTVSLDQKVHSRGNKSGVADSVPMHETMAADTPDPDETIDADREEKLLDEMLDALPEEQRTALLAYHGEGRGAVSIARENGWTVAETEKLLEDGLAELRRKFGTDGS